MNPPPRSYDEIVNRVGAPAVAVVLGVGQFQGLAVLRGLGQMGVPVYAVGEEKSLGFHSRYTRERFVSRDPHQHRDEWMKLLLGLGKRLKAEGKRAVLFPTRDSVVELIAEEQNVLSEYFLCHIPTIDVIRKCSDKEAQVRLARELGVPAPRTYMDNELPLFHQDRQSGQVSFPVILKPKKELPAHLKKKFRVVMIRDQAELDGVLKNVSAEKIPFLLQEIIPGEDDTLYTLGSCRGRDGEMKAVFTGRKLRQRPPRFGECRVGESAYVEDIIRDGEKLLRGLGFFGISQVEFKHDARDGKYKLMEVNPRSWSWISLPIAMGINLPFACFCDALGIEIPAQPMNRQRALYISLADDLYWSLKARDGRPWAHCFRGYDKIVEPFFTMSDPLPGLIHFQRTAFEFAGSFARQVGRKLGLTG